MSPRRGEEGVDLLRPAVEAADQADQGPVAAGPAIEDEAVGLEPGEHRLGQGDEDLVGLHRMVQPRPGQRLQPRRQPRRHGVGVGRVAQPQIVREIGLELGREKAHLGKQMAAALAPIAEIPGRLGTEEDHRLRRHGAVLGGAEGERVDPRLPGDLGRRATEPRHGVGEARAVDMQRQPVAPANLGDGGGLGHRVHGAGLVRLAQADRGRLDVMHLARPGLGQRGVGVLDASEIPPTYGMSPRTVQGVIAGGGKPFVSWRNVCCAPLAFF